MKKKNAYTLIEVLIAMLIFSINMLFAVVFFTYGQKKGITVDETGYALNLAKANIEQWKTLTYDNILSGPVSSGSDDSHVGDTRCVYAWQVFVTPVNDPINGEYKIIQTTVTWRYPSSPITSTKGAVSLSTVIAKQKMTIN
jgi:prepilin-type N-terminal cleavage/methylation domain-containing protein